jgi:hypothetical protein
MAPPVFLAPTAIRLKRSHIMSLADAILEKAPGDNIRDQELRLAAFALLSDWYEESRHDEFVFGERTPRVAGIGPSQRDKLRAFAHRMMDSLATKLKAGTSDRDGVLRLCGLSSEFSPTDAETVSIKLVKAFGRALVFAIAEKEAYHLGPCLLLLHRSRRNQFCFLRHRLPVHDVQFAKYT